MVFLFFFFTVLKARENIVGWYSTGSKTKISDVAIHELFFKYTPHPVYAIIDVQSQNSIELPVTTFIAKEELVEERINGVTTSTIVKQFHQIATEVGTLEAEDSYYILFILFSWCFAFVKRCKRQSSYNS